jgi:hypothetical protein
MAGMGDVRADGQRVVVWVVVWVNNNGLLYGSTDERREAARPLKGEHGLLYGSTDEHGLLYGSTTTGCCMGQQMNAAKRRAP